MAMSFGSGLFAVAAIWRTAEGRGGLISVVITVFLVAGCGASAGLAIRAPAEFSVDERGLTLASGKRFVPWADVDEIRVAHHHEDHYLALKLKPATVSGPRKFITTNKTNPEEVEVNLNHLSLGWRELVMRVESASGLHAASVSDGPFRLGSTPLERD
jgi:hypothetical protein